ncbi:DUF2855 family protein [Amycolatopsis australiensis]|uniref:DUF2855 family protein n=1 Tax=Amycolatopsis australiensis TaxID=546364 RepID=A0A1K1RKA2_9PSEU|nr:DUF2855 family protein [Amycolatopsis australiensis]SFW72504.1 Protein of unknown function [Amycolatopsis australiensis]
MAEKWEVLVRRDDFAATEIRTPVLDELRPGEVRLEIEKFGLTANNVSYARFGDGNVPFWNAFPAPGELGRVPLWSFVRVTESRNADVPAGGRYFGFVPMASHHTVQAEATPRGFVETAPQRAFLHPWYLTFQRAGEPDDLDDVRALVRPVFPASFNLADLVERQIALGAQSVLITSASCKTAIGLADELAARGAGIRAVGVTSAGNRAFVESLGTYDEVVTYDAIESAGVTAPAVLVDFTGSAKWLGVVYQHFAPSLSHGVLIGLTHPNPDDKAPPGLPDPQPEFFFTPVIEDQAIAAEGADAYYARYHEAETRFLRRLASRLAIRGGRGPAELAGAFRSVLAGDQAPDEGRVLLP